MIQWFKNLFKRDPAKRFTFGGDNPECGPAFARGECPDCGSKKFYEGPSGGMSTNWYCANEECREGFNVAMWNNAALSHNGKGCGMIIERIGKRKPMKGAGDLQ